MKNLSFYTNLLWELRYRYREHQITALSAQLAFFFNIIYFSVFNIFIVSIWAIFFRPRISHGYFNSDYSNGFSGDYLRIY